MIPNLPRSGRSRHSDILKTTGERATALQCVKVRSIGHARTNRVLSGGGQRAQLDVKQLDVCLEDEPSFRRRR
jgi:hypothetical protein